MNNPGFLAFDLGASGGRAIFGSINRDRLELKEIDRFDTGMLHIYNNWHWNIFRFFEEIKKGIRKCVSVYNLLPCSMAINTWGVDFGLFSQEGELLGLPFAYRDSRTDGMMEKFFQLIPKEEVYRLTGIQFMQINSLFQLYSMKFNDHSLLKAAKDLLFIPDILNYFLTGTRKTEFSFATTSQMYNPQKGYWEEKLFEKMEVPIDIMQSIIQPGTKLGSIKKTIAGESSAGDLTVYSAVSHDTGSAVAAVPAQGQGWAFISSGTWSLLGVEAKAPILSDLALHLNFTNEGGVDSSFRVQKNLTGLWIVQKLKESVKELSRMDYPEIMEKASKCREFIAFIDPDHSDFMNPVDMREAMINYCKRTGQEIPVSPFEFIRIALESLALKYRYSFEQLYRIYPHPINRIHIIGGGSNNRLLNQFTADATKKTVFAGPSEATSIGNIIVQAKSYGCVASIKEAREIIKNSFPIKEYKPLHPEKWDKTYKKYTELNKKFLRGGPGGVVFTKRIPPGRRRQGG